MWAKFRETRSFLSIGNIYFDIVLYKEIGSLISRLFSFLCTTGHPFWHLTALFMETILPLQRSILNLPKHNLRPFPLILSDCMGREADTCPATTSFQVIIKDNKVSSDPTFLQAQHSQPPQLLLAGLVLQTLPQHCYPPLTTHNFKKEYLIGVISCQFINQTQES